VPEYINKTAMEQARHTFQFDGPGSFTLNLKSTVTLDKDIDYIEVWEQHLSMIQQTLTLSMEGIHPAQRCR